MTPIQIKTFSGSEDNYVDQEVNDWLRANHGKVDIINIQNSSNATSNYRRLYITICYREADDGLEPVVPPHWI